MKNWKLRILLSGIVFCFLLSFSGCTAKNTEIAGENPGVKITFFDVGKGDSILIETLEHTMLIDAGCDDTYPVIQDYFAKENIQQLDYLLITHFDKDHVGGADWILENYKVKEILQPDYASDSSPYLDYCSVINKQKLQPISVTESKRFTLDEAEFYIYPPQEKTYKEEDNDFSLVISMRYGEKSFLFAGDCEKERLQELLDQTEFTLSHNVLKVPHHGKKEKNSQEFFEAVSPQIAVITCSEEEPASDKVYKMLTKLDADVYLTSDGTISLLCDGKSISKTS